jgi:ABC-2 type transport system ATP-binding protein
MTKQRLGDDALSISFSNVTKRYGAVTALDGFSAEVAPGRITAFLGANGSGKTTSMRLLLGLAEPTAGTAFVGGRAYHELEHPLRSVGAVLDQGFQPNRSARNHLRIVAAQAGVPASRVDDVLDLVGLTDAAHRRAGKFSLGMRQRLALATALLGDPAVLVLDEPANGLDPEGIQWLRGFLRHLAHEQGRTILVSSHLLSEVEQTVDRVVIVGAGRLVREGSMEQLRSGADGAGTVLVRGPEMGRLAEVLSAHGSDVTRDDGALTVTGSTPAEIGHRAFTAGIELHELRSRTSGLEEIYFQLTSGQEQFAAPPAGTPVAQEATR